MQYQVPQFIDVEEKIVGPFSLKQFIYIAIGAGGALFFGFTIKPALLKLIACALWGGAGIALALVKIDGQSLPKLLMLAILYYWRPQSYIWQPETPKVQKNPENLRRQFAHTFDLEKIVAGFALKDAWTTVQTGVRSAPHLPQFQRPPEERYAVLSRTSGEKRLAKRVDYR